MPVLQFVNLTDWSITITSNDGSPILQNLKPRKTKNIKNKNISKDGLKLVNVLKDHQFANVHIKQSDLTKYATVVFKIKEAAGDEQKILQVEGTHANKLVTYINIIGRLVRKVRWWWDKLPTELIAREEQGPNQPAATSPDYSKKKVRRLNGVNSEPNILHRR